MKTSPEHTCLRSALPRPPGKGAVFTYDAIGSYERTGYSCQGSGQALIMPVLDNQLKAVSPLVLPAVSSATPLSEAEAVDLVKDCFATAVRPLVALRAN